MKHDVAGDAHGVLEVALNLIENILGRTTEQNSAGLGVLALGEVGEVFVADLLNLEQAAPRADIGVLEILDPVDDGGAGGAGYSVVIGLADTAEGADVVLEEVVLGKIYRKLVCLECHIQAQRT